MAGETWAFVGRDRELGEIGHALDEAHRGRGRLCLISGAAGMGKSRLLDEAAALASERGLQPVWGRCWESGTTPAYWPWTQVLRDLAVDDSLRGRLSGRQAALLAQLEPSLGDEAAAGVAIDADRAHFQLLDALTEAVRLRSEAGPLAVFLEDLHAADVASLETLAYAVAHLRGSPVAFFATWRPREPSEPAVADALQQLAQHSISMPLRSLSLDDIETFLAGALGRAPGRAFAELLLEATGGNALFVAETARLVAATSGSLPADIDALPVPDSVRAVYLRRTDALPTNARRLLETASVFGRDVRPGLLSNVADADSEQIARDLAVAVDAALLVELPDGDYRFSHILCREALYRSLTTADRWRLHQRAADALSAAEGGVGKAAAIADQLRQAGPAASEGAARACCVAGDAALDRLAFADAVDWYARAQGCAARMAVDDPRLRWRILLSSGRALVLSGAPEPGRERCREAAELARSLSEPELFARAVLVYGSVIVPGQLNAEFIELLREALAGLPEGDGCDRARLLARLAAALQPSSEPEEPIAMARDAIAMARRIGDDPTLLDALRSGVAAMVDLGDARERQLLNREHAALATALGRAEDTWRATLRLCVDCLELAELTEMDRQLETLEQVARDIDHPYYRWPVLSLRAGRRTAEGDFAGAEELIEELAVLARELDDAAVGRALVMVRAGLARTRRRGDELSRVLPELERAVFGGIPASFAHSLCAGDWVRVGRLDRARQLLEQHDLSEVVGYGDPTILNSVAQYAVAIDDRPLLERVYRVARRREGCLSHWGIFGGGACDGAMDRLLGQLAAALDDRERARAHFEAAIALLERLGLAPHIAGTREAATAALGDCGSSPRTSASDTSLSSVRLRRVGESWELSCDGASFLLRDTKGVRLLARLLDAPGERIHVFDLLDAPAEARDPGDAGAAIDPRARDAYRARAREIETELQEAVDWNDAGRVERLRAELDAIATELSRSLGVGGRARSAGANSERARVNVQRRIKDALRRIAEHAPDLARRLDRAVQTGTFCSFDPV